MLLVRRFKDALLIPAGVGDTVPRKVDLLVPERYFDFRRAMPRKHLLQVVATVHDSRQGLLLLGNRPHIRIAANGFRRWSVRVSIKEHESGRNIRPRRERKQ